MTLLAAEKISKKFDDRVLFDRVSFTILGGDRIGLVGKNGSGKTTLFEMLVGLQEVDSGAITHSKRCHIDYIEQEKADSLDTSLFDYVASARRDLLDMRHEISRLEEHLSRTPDDGPGLQRLGQLQSRYEIEGGFNFENDVETILNGLSFPDDRHGDRTGNFSGGEKNRAGLARALAGKGNLILLDEPTNHLDIESTCWLEEYLARTDKAFIVVSHDRTFLQNTVTRVWEVSEARIDTYVGSFEKYLSERAKHRQLQQHHYRHQQQEIKRIEDFVRRNMAGQKTKQAQSKLRYLERIKRIELPALESQSPTINMKSSGRSFAHVLAVERVSVGYGTRAVVEDVSFDVYRGDKVGMIGPNGSGKSTILKALIGELAPMTGDIRLGSNVDVVYFDQELSELDPNRTVLESLWEVDPGVEGGTIRSFLARFGFTGDESLKPVSALSGGEKTKLSLARILYHPANFIIFDEPTNHLDLISREVLEAALTDYEGSCLIVSHDRFFLDRVVNKILYVRGGKLSKYDGNYSYFREKQAIQAPPPPTKERKSAEAFLSFKEKSKQRSRLKKEIEATCKKIAAAEEELERLTEALNSQIPKSDWEKLSEATNRKNELEDEVLKLYQKLESLQEVESD